MERLQIGEAVRRAQFLMANMISHHVANRVAILMFTGNSVGMSANTTVEDLPWCKNCTKI
jgi:hypothetical protein